MVGGCPPNSSQQGFQQPHTCSLDKASPCAVGSRQGGSAQEPCLDNAICCREAWSECPGCGSGCDAAPGARAADQLGDRPWICTSLELSDELLLVPVIQEQRPLVPTVISWGAVPRQLVGLQRGQRHLADVADLVPGCSPRGVPVPVIHANVHADLGRGEGLHAALSLGLVPL